MLRHWCDHCGNEIKEQKDVSTVSMACLEGEQFQLCRECKSKWDDIEQDYWEKQSDLSAKFERARIEFLNGKH